VTARYFTLDEANALLGTLRPLMRDILHARQQIMDARPELWPVLVKAAHNGGSKHAGELLGQFDVIQRNLRAIQKLGVEVKDLDQGLVDFRSRRDDRDIYLCWRYDESAVTHWHELDAGFAGRQSL